MPATKITDLLPIAEGTSEPHAYQVFGLDDGEQDRAKITKAVQATVARIRAAKSSTDPKLWNKVARLVQQSRVVLADPEKKAQLDARFGIISIEGAVDSDVAQPAGADPLSGVLPPSEDPLAAVLPTSNPLAPNPLAPVPSHPEPTQTLQPTPTDAAAAQPHVGNAMPPGVFGTPQVSAGEATVGQTAVPTATSVPASPAPAPAAPVVVRRTKKRRRRSILGTLFFAVFTLGMFGLIGGLMYFLLYGPGQVAITSTDGQITIRTEPDGAAPRVNQPMVVNQDPRPRDPVMGDLPAAKPRTLRTPRPGDRDAAGTSPPTSAAPTVDASPAPETPPTPPARPTMAGPTSESSPGPATASAGQSASPIKPAGQTRQPVSDEMIAEANKTLGRVRDLIRQAKWKEMKVAAQAATEMPMTDPQSVEAEALYSVADLATYYRGAIERAVADLKVGNDFAVTDSFRVIIVETGPDLVVVRYNAKNQSFTFDELPFSMVHRLATFALPDSPTSQAAKAVYQAIAPKASDSHRNEAIKWLGEIDGQVEGADPNQLSQTIETLFGEDA